MSAERAAAYTVSIRDSFLLERMRADGNTAADRVEQLLRVIAEAWVQAEAAPISENEAQRWSRVCSAAERVVGL